MKPTLYLTREDRLQRIGELLSKGVTLLLKVSFSGLAAALAEAVGSFVVFSLYKD